LDVLVRSLTQQALLGVQCFGPAAMSLIFTLHSQQCRLQRLASNLLLYYLHHCHQACCVLASRHDAV